MLSLTRSVTEVVGWFKRTHEVEAVGMGGGAVWRMRRLPRDGGLADQDAWLMEALDYSRAISNRLLDARRSKRDEFDELHGIHDDNRREKRGGETVH